MSNTVIKGKIQNYERSEKYDEDGNKFIQYWIIVDGKKYIVRLPGRTDIWFENNLEVILNVDESNLVIGGLATKKGFKWGITSSLKEQVSETDRFELVEGIVQEKRKETFNQSRGTTG